MRSGPPGAASRVEAPTARAPRAPGRRSFARAPARAEQPLGQADRRRLLRAVELGRGGWGRVHPNPMVGAVVVREGTTLAEARHEEFGAPHAEILALAAAGDARGATVYSSLEPCAHAGKTPPCADALAAAGVARVVYWAPEPGRREGGGAARLRAAGVQVDGPFGAPAEWAAENPFFFHRRDGPFVALKLAVSADARIAPPGGRRAWITGPAARREAHRIRAGFDAIVVGARTWRADDPRLTARGPTTPRVPPARVLLDRAGEVPRQARAFSAEGGPAFVAVAPERAASARRRLGRRAEVLAVPAAPTITPATRPIAPAAHSAVPAAAPTVPTAGPAASAVPAAPTVAPAAAPTVPIAGPAASAVPAAAPSASPGPSAAPIAQAAPPASSPSPPLLDLAALLASLEQRGFSRVLCEGGGRLGASLLAGGQVDRAYLFFAPGSVGRAGVPAFPVPASGAATNRRLAEYVEALAARTGASPCPPPPGWRLAAEPASFCPDVLVVLDRTG